jgi:hypothetical protein
MKSKILVPKQELGNDFGLFSDLLIMIHDSI